MGFTGPSRAALLLSQLSPWYLSGLWCVHGGVGQVGAFWSAHDSSCATCSLPLRCLVICGISFWQVLLPLEGSPAVVPQVSMLPTSMGGFLWRSVSQPPGLATHSCRSVLVPFQLQKGSQVTSAVRPLSSSAALPLRSFSYPRSPLGLDHSVGPLLVVVPASSPADQPPGCQHSSKYAMDLL